MVAGGGSAGAGEDAFPVILPGRRWFPELKADALEPRMALSRVLETREWVGAVGGAVPLVEAPVGGVRLQAGVSAVVISRLIKSPGHITVSTVDYRVDFPLDIVLQDAVLRTGYGHLSAHFADDGIEQLGHVSISFVKDYLLFLAAYGREHSDWKLYGGGTYSYHNEPVADRPWMLQMGGETPGARLPWCFLYAALDLKLRQEVGWGSTQSYEAGAVFGGDGRRGMRFAVTHRRGLEERGQFFRRRMSSTLLSIVLGL